MPVDHIGGVSELVRRAAGVLMARQVEGREGVAE